MHSDSALGTHFAVFHPLSHSCLSFLVIFFLILQTKLLLNYVLSLAKYDMNYDLRDRARLIRGLLLTKVCLCKGLLKFSIGTWLTPNKPFSHVHRRTGCTKRPKSFSSARSQRPTSNRPSLVSTEPPGPSASMESSFFSPLLRSRLTSPASLPSLPSRQTATASRLAPCRMS